MRKTVFRYLKFVLLYLPLRAMSNNIHSCVISGTQFKFLSIMNNNAPVGIVSQINLMVDRATGLP